MLPEDGRSTIIAFIELQEEHDNRSDPNWHPDAKLLAIFTIGVPGHPVSYPKDDSLAARKVYQAGCHHIDNNQVAHTDVYTIVQVAQYALQQGQGNLSQAEAYLMAQHGKGSRRAANKWILAAKQLPAAVVETLKDMTYLKTSYILENDLFC